MVQVTLLAKLSRMDGGPYGTIFATFSSRHRQKCSVSCSSCEVSHNGEPIDCAWVCESASRQNLKYLLSSHEESRPILYGSSKSRLCAVLFILVFRLIELG